MVGVTVNVADLTIAQMNADAAAAGAHVAGGGFNFGPGTRHGDAAGS